MFCLYDSMQHERPQTMSKECGKQLRYQHQRNGGDSQRHWRQHKDQSTEEKGNFFHFQLSSTCLELLNTVGNPRLPRWVNAIVMGGIFQ